MQKRFIESNVKTCFLGKIRENKKNISICRLPQILSRVLSVNKLVNEKLVNCCSLDIFKYIEILLMMITNSSMHIYMYIYGNASPPPLFYKYKVNSGRFILILKITNQFLCKYIYILYIYLKHISHVKLAIYTFFKIDLSHYAMFIHLN